MRCRAGTLKELQNQTVENRESNGPRSAAHRKRFALRRIREMG
jgi:hypothetical protein